MNKLHIFFQKLVHDIPVHWFALFLSLWNCVYYPPFFRFAAANVGAGSWNGVLILVSLALLVPIANFFVFYLLLFLTRIVGKVLISITFILNAMCVYFINTYSVIIDKSMIGNIFNTQWSEASGFFSIMMIVYVLFLGIMPCVYVFAAKVDYGKWKTFGWSMLGCVVSILVLVFANASNWLWIDKHSTKIGALTMPWSYVANTYLYAKDIKKQNQKEIPLPDATISNHDKAVMVLVIGESARRENFSLYGYDKETNPLLAQTPNVKAYPAEASATYTTAGVKAILDHKRTSQLYEILPNYLYRNGVDVIWRTTNWGEPPVHIDTYQKRGDLEKLTAGEDSPYDEILLTNLTQVIQQSEKDKILIILHTSISHGPQYSQRYPAHAEHFQPVCNSVELAHCSQEELMNAYDNTIVYTDYILKQIIDTLQSLPDYHTAMMYVSDHGESLGENNLYMHGVPMSIAPKEQYEIPFIVWTSPSAQRGFKENEMLSHYHVFHSVMNFLSVASPIYDENMNIFQ